MQIGGLHIQYYFVCQRKLWLYAKNLGQEEDHERVLDGKLLHEHAYQRARKREIYTEEGFKVDALDGEYVREIKLSSKMTKADQYQLLFYLYQLKKRGLVRKGLISYTREKRTEELELSEENEKELEKIIEDINMLLSKSTVPPLIHKSYCRKCAYYDFCYINEAGEV